jgi:hypothetical protein
MPTKPSRAQKSRVALVLRHAAKLLDVAEAATGKNWQLRQTFHWSGPDR